MRLQKRIVCFGMAALLLFAPSMKADAATHKPGCSATAKTVVCTTYVGMVSDGSHILYTTVNGPVTCAKKSEIYRHNVYCANDACKVILQQDHSRRCTRHHTYCPDETGLCKY